MTAPFQLTQPVIYDRALHEQLLKTAVTDLETTKDQQVFCVHKIAGAENDNNEILSSWYSMQMMTSAPHFINL
jgi:hypothetical protein